MKKFDKIMIYIAALLLIVLLLSYASVGNIVKVLAGLCFLVFVIHWKIAPYKANLSPKYFDLFAKAEKLIIPILNLFKGLPKIQIGPNFYLDTAPVAVCGLLLIILIVL